MGTSAGRLVDKWLGDGGIVLAASDRAARALQRAYHHRRQDDGLTAWPAPAIHSWPAFTRTEWEERESDNRMLLTPMQEQSLWAEIIGREAHLATVLEGPRESLAALAMRANELLASYSPRYLQPAARSGWDCDHGIFSTWLTAFDRICRQQDLLSPSIAPLKLIDLLKTDTAERPRVLIVGFDRLLPVQREILDAWGSWQQMPPEATANEPRYYTAEDDATELAACAAWCRRHLKANSQSRLLVIAQNISARRGEIERVFLQLSTSGEAPLFEFSLGVPLGAVPLIRATYLVLRWLSGTLLENEVDWLLSIGLTTFDRVESVALQRHMRLLRRRGLARTDWSLDAFARQSAIFEGALGSWYRRMMRGRAKLLDLQKRPRSPFEWVRAVPTLLESLGIPGGQRLASVDFQAWRRWEQALDNCGGLGFDGRRIGWREFLGTLEHTLSETLFTPESSDAPILIAGPAESAGLTADAIWFLGVDQESWPTTGTAHPFLPIHVQREAEMPHSTKRADWELAEAITGRLAVSAQEVCFSYPRQEGETDAHQSRLVKAVAGAAQPIPADLTPPLLPDCAAVSFNDTSRIPFPLEQTLSAQLPGGAASLTAQSQCPFKAFATVRLAAQGWDAAEYALSPSQRGKLLHATMQSIWSGPPDGLRSLNDLRAVANKTAFVSAHVEKALHTEALTSVLEHMPKGYLDLEALRLTRLVCKWLDYEEQRVSFTVIETEAKHAVNICDLALTVQLDRLDRLCDGSVAVIDYKTGSAAALKTWELPRPDDVQLPLYASFALEDEKPGALLFARLRAGDSRFIGHARDARETLRANLASSDQLVRQPLIEAQLRAWKDAIERLAHDFLEGAASVDPHDFPHTCERCDLHAVCRIHENRSEPPLEEGAEDESDD